MLSYKAPIEILYCFISHILYLWCTRNLCTFFMRADFLFSSGTFHIILILMLLLLFLNSAVLLPSRNTLLWNSLPAGIRQPDNDTGEFRRQRQMCIRDSTRRPRSLCSPWNFAVKSSVLETRVMGLSTSEDHMIVAGVVLAWYQRVTDGQTVGRSDRIYHS